MAITYELNPTNGEIFYCALHDKRWDPSELSAYKCPWCQNTLVSWYTKIESKDRAKAKWYDHNPHLKKY